jgi:hypothetical protein
MATQDTYPTQQHLSAESQTETTIESRVAIVGRSRRHRAEHQRRVIVQRLRRTADHARDPRRSRWHGEQLLDDIRKRDVSALDRARLALQVAGRAVVAFARPETRAYSGNGLPEQPSHRVGYVHREVWPGYQPSRRPRRVSISPHSPRRHEQGHRWRQGGALPLRRSVAVDSAAADHHLQY